MTVLQTERLTLRPLVAADAELYAGMRYHPEVAKWLSPVADGADPLDSARATIGRFQQSWQERRYAPWGLFCDGALIGHGGLNWVPEFGETEVLWALHPEAWGQGYAAEAVTVMCAHLAVDHGVTRLTAHVAPGNTASRALLERLGFSFVRRTTEGDLLLDRRLTRQVD